MTQKEQNLNIPLFENRIKQKDGEEAKNSKNKGDVIDL